MIPTRLLLSRTDRMGDLILSTPVATALKKRFPEIEIHFLVREYAAEVLSLHPHVDGVIQLDDRAAVSARKLAARLRPHEFDAVIALYPRPQLAWAFFRAGIPLRIGTGYRWYSFLYNRRIYEHRKHALRHEAECNLQLLRPFDIYDAQVEFSYRFDFQEERQFAGKLRALGVEKESVILHPGSGGSAREWPAEHFAALADYLDTGLHVPVVITGSQDERSIAQRLVQQCRTKPVDLTGRLTMKELAMLIHRARLFVGNSTGPLHLARMVGTPVVSFYPPIRACRPERWGPYGCLDDVLMSQQEECFRCRHSEDRVCDCMRAISVKSAIEKVNEKLDRRNVSSNPYSKLAMRMR